MKLLTAAESVMKRTAEKAIKDNKRPVLIVSQKYLDNLYEYSCSLPTGTIVGKRWKRNIHPECNGAAGYPPEKTKWIIGEYYDCNEEGKIGIMWWDIKII
jgi:hypothetical protein